MTANEKGLSTKIILCGQRYNRGPIQMSYLDEQQLETLKNSKHSVNSCKISVNTRTSAWKKISIFRVYWTPQSFGAPLNLGQEQKKWTEEPMYYKSDATEPS